MWKMKKILRTRMYLGEYNKNKIYSIKKHGKIKQLILKILNQNKLGFNKIVYFIINYNIKNKFILLFLNYIIRGKNENKCKKFIDNLYIYT